MLWPTTSALPCTPFQSRETLHPARHASLHAVMPDLRTEVRAAQRMSCLQSGLFSLRAWHCGCRWRILSCLPRTVALVVKALTQALWLLAMLLFWMPSPDVILLQASQEHLDPPQSTPPDLQPDCDSIFPSKA